MIYSIFNVAKAATIEEIVNYTIDNAIQPFIYFLIVLATVVFIWGVIEFIYGAQNETKRTDGKRHILWGIIGLSIIISVFGIMRVLLNFWNSV